MKRNFIKVSLALSPIVFLSGCNFMQVGHSPSGYVNPNRVSVVEKAWKARHEYDTDSGLLRPYYRGMRYGAVRSYDKQEKTVASKEWWIKDQKLGDLADQPFRTTPTRLPPQITPATAVAGTPATPVGGDTAANPAGFVESPAAGAASATPGAPSGATTTNVEVFGSGSGAGLPVFATGEETPAMPATPGAITGEALGIDSPFLPSAPAVPGSLPPVPGAAFPGAALPGAPIGNTPFGVDPAVPGGGAPAMPAPGGDNPFGAPAPAPGGDNPFGAPAPAVPAPGGDNPFPAPPAPGGDNPFPAPPAPGGDNPFPAPPAPGGDNPFPAPPAPGGDNPFPPPPAP